MEQYKELMPFIVRTCSIMGLMESDPKLFEGVASWLFMFRMTEELSEFEIFQIHKMFWDALNQSIGGKIPSDIIAKCVDAVESWGNINITIGGDIIEYAIDMWNESH
jgi:hypothetical protein